VGIGGAAVVGLLFPGQGSQFVGMGRDLVAASAPARATFEEADDALGFALSRVCFDGPESELTATATAQPAILTHSVAVLRAIGERMGPVAMAAGHSLGEFSAWVAAGSFAFVEALRVVRLRGELMQRGGEARPGTMAALLGLEDAAVDALCRSVSRDGSVCVPANYNAPGQVVVSGDVDAVERALAGARAAGAKRALRLNVSGAFHSPLMAVALDGLRARLASAALAEPAFPVVSNVTAEPVRSAERARALLVEQLVSPVRWTACIAAMRAAGVDRFVELGPGSVLTGLLRRIDRAAAAAAVGTAEQVEAWAA
jgi:[acyl-carrier-protein] S-malonyltransferase